MNITSVAEQYVYLLVDKPHDTMIMQFLDLKDHTNGFNLVCKKINKKYNDPYYFKTLIKSAPLILSEPNILNCIYNEFKDSKNPEMDYVTYTQFYTNNLKENVRQAEEFVKSHNALQAPFSNFFFYK